MSDEPGSSPKRALRGFRKRWTSEKSVSAGSGLSSPERSTASQVYPDGLQSFDADFDPEGFAGHASWILLQPDLSSAEQDFYEPESPLPDLSFDSGVPTVVDSGGSEPAWQQSAITAVVKRQKFEQPKLPWEHPPFGLIFRTADKWTGTAVSNLPDMLRPTTLGSSDVFNTMLVQERCTSSAATISAPPVVPLNLRKVRHELPDEDIRRVALCRLRELLLQDPSASQLGVSIVAMQETGYSRTTAEQSISDCFRMKASSTLQKRAGSLWRLARVLRSQGVLTPLRVTEEQLYGALCTLRETGAGATSAQHVLEALFFLDSTAKLILIELRLVVSGRCRGVARDMFLSKNPLEQKQPLTLAHVQFLETLFHSLPNTMKCILGQLLFCIHACCRWRDSQRVQCLWSEEGHGETLIHADAIGSKTTLSAEARTRYLPYIALGSGVNGRDWGASWISARDAEGLECGEFILPSFSERVCRWVDTPMSASEATYWLREFL